MKTNIYNNFFLFSRICRDPTISFKKKEKKKKKKTETEYLISDSINPCVVSQGHVLRLSFFYFCHFNFVLLQAFKTTR